MFRKYIYNSSLNFPGDRGINIDSLGCWSGAAVLFSLGLNLLAVVDAWQINCNKTAPGVWRKGLEDPFCIGGSEWQPGPCPPHPPPPRLGECGRCQVVPPPPHPARATRR